MRPLDIHGRDKLVYEAIYENIKDFAAMRCKYTYRQIGEDIRREFGLEYNVKAIKKSIDLLKEKGYIVQTVVGKKGVPSEFEVVKIDEIKGKQIDNRLETDKQQKNVEIPTDNGTKETDRQQKGNISGTPYKEKDKEKEKINKKETSLDKMISAYTENIDLVEAIRDFIKMRKSIKKPLTDRALKTILNKLDKFGRNDFEKILILENSIEHCWQSVFELKDNKKAPTAIGTEKNNKLYSSICNNGKNYTRKMEVL